MSREALSDEAIAGKVSALKSGGGLLGPAVSAAAVDGSASFPSAARRSFVKPLLSAAEGLIESLRIEDGIGTGLLELDALTRGFRPSDFVIFTGFAHSGKTQLVNTMILENPAKRVLFFSLDDPAEMILAKLVAMYTGIPSEQLEARVRAGDPEANAIIREAAESTFENLLVVDDVIGITSMQEAVKEATEVWGRKPDAVVIDYLEMMPGSGVADDDGANIKQKANSLKAWAKHAPFPIICLHQGTRSNAKPGNPITLLSMGHSGEQQATIVLGCRRKRDRDDLEGWERQNIEDTITVHIVKNKRPGGRCTHFEGIDFYMHAPTGMIRPLSASETGRLEHPNSAATRMHNVSPGPLASLGAIEVQDEIL